MGKGRLEAFSDGVIAIIITIMVLGLQTPAGTSWEQIKPLIPKFISYVLSFLYVAIYWGNHHHLLHTVKRVCASIIWANFNLLFWLSLVPFATTWMGENHFDKITVSVYAMLLVICAIAYGILNRAIIRSYTEKDELKNVLQTGNWKIIVSLILYASAIPIALFIHPFISGFIFFAGTAIWIIPDKKIARAVEKEQG